jgi:hypothetical protein
MIRKSALIVGLLAVALMEASACTIPVFRYALNNWPGDQYELRAGAVQLPTNAVANLVVTPGKDGPARLLLGQHEIWSGTLTKETLAAILDSPVRREVVKRIVHGDAAVWVLVESGNASADAAALRTLTDRLKYLQSVIQLPEQDPNDPSSQLGPGPALAARFSVVSLSRKDPREAFTLAMLERSPEKTPTAFPVFGRGRVLAVLPQKDLTPENIEDVSAFLIGECSCQIKAAHMGWDLLVNCNWDEELERVDEERRAVPMPTAQAEMKPETVMIEGQTAEKKLSSREMLLLAFVPLVLAGIIGIICSKRQA